MRDHCEAIAGLWIELNPHCSVEGCEVDGGGTVHLRLWYRRENKMQPLEIILGNPPSQVLRTLRNALNEQARAKRLSKVSGGQIVKDSEMTGNSESGQVGRRDK